MAIVRDSIYHAIFHMTGKELAAYTEEWHRRYPGKEEHYEEFIEPYTYPAYMLFCAPVNNQLMSFFKVITDMNKLEQIPTPAERPVLECPECGLDVTALVMDKCLGCWSLATLDEIAQP